jgi:hypothetical protein
MLLNLFAWSESTALAEPHPATKHFAAHGPAAKLATPRDPKVARTVSDSEVRLEGSSYSLDPASRHVALATLESVLSILLPKRRRSCGPRREVTVTQAQEYLAPVDSVLYAMRQNIKTYETSTTR